MNILKGYVTTILGLLIMVFSCLVFFGIVNVGHDMSWRELAGGFAVGIALFLVPPTKIEQRLEKGMDKLMNKE